MINTGMVIVGTDLAGVHDSTFSTEPSSALVIKESRALTLQASHHMLDAGVILKPVHG